MLIGEDSARGHVVRIVRTVNIANGRCSYRFGDVCGSILGRGNFGFGPDRARRILLGGKRVRIDECFFRTVRPQQKCSHAASMFDHSRTGDEFFALSIVVQLDVWPKQPIDQAGLLLLRPACRDTQAG